MTVSISTPLAVETSPAVVSSKPALGVVLVRQLKLRLNRQQEAKINGWLWNLTGVWNFAVRKIELDAKDLVYHSAFDFQNLLAGHSHKIGIPSHVLQGVLSHDRDQNAAKVVAKIGAGCALKEASDGLN